MSLVTGRRGRKTGLRIVAVAAAVLALALAAGCGEGPTGPGLPEITLPIRVHVTASPVTTLDATFTDQQVRTLVSQTNQIWAQADINWKIDSIVHDSMTAAADSILTAYTLHGDSIPPDFLEIMVPNDRIPGGGWDVFLMHDLAIFGFQGAYDPIVPDILTSESTGVFGEPNDAILAHELGHSLGLQHVACSPEGNLMTPGTCSPAGTDPAHLTMAQVDSARAQAELGTPWVSGGLSGSVGPVIP